MLFNSLGFVGFFALFFVIYWALLSKRLRVQNVWLLVGSVFFYGCWDWRFLSLIGITVATTYATAIWSERGHARCLTALNIAVNLAILCTFKYFNFFSENVVRLMQWLGVGLDWFTLDVLLPVGISFYTFQAIGYSVDVYKRRVRAERDFVTFAVFICYFPQLVAGPIESARSLLPQIKRPRIWHRPEIVDGMRQALWGLVKKVVIADACAPHVDKAFSGALADVSLPTVVLAALLFSVQIYCDFSGYCDIARGVSRCLGIDLTQNFRYPYFSHNVQEFWRRWNLSLMTWFREYVYIPLGGSRHGQRSTYANVFLVFLLSGLWHGASWCFVLWGVYWGLIMIAYRLADRNLSITIPKPYGALVTCWLAVIGWVIFRSGSIGQAAEIIVRVAPATAAIACLGAVGIAAYRLAGRHIPGLANIALWGAVAVVTMALLVRPVEVVHGYLLIFIAAMFVAEWHGRRLDCPLIGLHCRPWLRIGIYWLLILLVLTNYMEDMPFIYFQF